jgi:demethylsterigmatocystin 6-O-methyltransferase
LLRYQSAAYNVEEASTGKFKASCKTGFLALPGTEAAINHNFLTVSNNFLHLPLFLADSGYENPGDSANTPAHLAFNHEGDLSTWFATHPVHAAAAFGFFATQRADQQGCFTKAPLNMYALQGTEQDEKRVLLCDVGGGAGHQCLAFRTQRPELEGLLAVTDLPIMIEQQDQAALRAQGIISLADDFFSAEDYPAAVRSAKMYYLRNILHDWNDEQSVKILRRIRKVAAKDSVLLVDEIIIPDAGASIAACNMDLSMMTISSAERSASQWRFLLSEAGFEVEKMWCYDEDRGDHLITATCSSERC